VLRWNDELTLDFSDYSDDVVRTLKIGYWLRRETHHDASWFLSAQVLRGDGRYRRIHYYVNPC